MSTTTAIATKDQEWKALASIKKIVEGLGPQSYIATAFEGCFQDAEENIENDFACSMKGRYEAEHEKAVHNEGIATEACKQLAAEKQKLTDLQDRLDEMDGTLSSTYSIADSLKQFLAEQKEATAAQQQRADAAEQTIVQLKAKLYDLLVK
ncbi:MAG: hypothetical protein EOM52_02310 [Clostridia bacterium]|nr:hypothetical protein [Clostridia bacterium]